MPQTDEDFDMANRPDTPSYQGAGGGSRARSRALTMSLSVASLAMTALACSPGASTNRPAGQIPIPTGQHLSHALQLTTLNRTAARPAPDTDETGLFYARIERRELAESSLRGIFEFLAKREGQIFAAKNFRLTDDLNLQTSRYQRFVQTAAINGDQGAQDIDGTSLRVWSDLRTGHLILAEAFLLPMTESVAALSSETRSEQVQKNGAPSVDGGSAEIWARRDLTSLFAQRKVLATRTAALLKATKKGLELRQRLTVKTKFGSWKLDYDPASGHLVSKTFREVSYADSGPAKTAEARVGAYALPATVYPLWELPASARETDALAAPSQVELANLLGSVPSVSLGSTLSAGTLQFRLSQKVDHGLTPREILQGYWNLELINFLFPDPWNSLSPQVSNFPSSSSALRLYGRNVTVMLHPDVTKHFDTPAHTAPKFALAPKFVSSYDDEASSDDDDSEPLLRYRPLKWGVPIQESSDLLHRSPFSSDGLAHPERTAELVQAGFDEAQVYYATDVFLSTFQKIGFRDPGMSTRPFIAILFDPDIESRDNAYYDDNTINFATYSAGEMNMARDNTTIWHELGHGLQDRLMGPHLDSAEGYGLWEGMADFLAQMIIAERFGTRPFAQRSSLRILNRTHFYLTNESHDEGEAYGGAMNTMLESLMAHFGDREGLLRMADLTLETMRLTRDHPRLTAAIWFEQMKYVDSLNREVTGFERQPSELLPFIKGALSSRNYSAGRAPASFEVRYGTDGSLLTDRGPGSRGEPIELEGDPSEIRRFPMRVSLKNGDNYNFHFPVTVRLTTSGGPLQGAVRWDGESQGPRDFVLNGPDDVAEFEVGVDPSACDFVNRSEGGCKDYVYLLLFDSNGAAPPSSSQPIGKKRFYVAVPN